MMNLKLERCPGYLIHHRSQRRDSGAFTLRLKRSRTEIFWKLYSRSRTCVYPALRWRDVVWYGASCKHRVSRNHAVHPKVPNLLRSSHNYCERRDEDMRFYRSFSGARRSDKLRLRQDGRKASMANTGATVSRIQRWKYISSAWNSDLLL